MDNVSRSGDMDDGYGGMEVFGRLSCLDVGAGLGDRLATAPAYSGYGRTAAVLLFRDSQTGQSSENQNVF